MCEDCSANVGAQEYKCGNCERVVCLVCVSEEDGWCRKCFDDVGESMLDTTVYLEIPGGGVPCGECGELVGRASVVIPYSRGDWAFIDRPGCPRGCDEVPE